MQETRPVPVGLPRWLARRQPALLAMLLGSSNALRRRPLRTWSIAALAIGTCWLVAWIPATAAVLEWLAAHRVLTGTIVASFIALSIMRRRSRVRAHATVSWLAALPVSASLLPRAAGMLARLSVLFFVVGLAWLGGRIGASAVVSLAVACAAGAPAGAAAGTIVSRALGLDSPGSQCATARRARARWAEEPSLLPLSYWPVAQGRIFSRPKSLSRVALLVALCLPMGTPGQAAIVIAAACLAIFSILSLSVAAARVAFDAARWLAPTGVDRLRFAFALEWRVLLKQAAGGALLVALARLIGLRWAFRIGIPACLAVVLASCALAALSCSLACRRAGLGAGPRGL